MDYKPKITTFPHFFTLPPNTIGEEAENWEIKGIIQGDEQKNEPKHYELYNKNTNDTIYIKCKNKHKLGYSSTGRARGFGP